MPVGWERYVARAALPRRYGLCPMVSAANNELMMASSVAPIVAIKSGDIRSLGSVGCSAGESATRTSGAAEKAMTLTSRTSVMLVCGLGDITPMCGPMCATRPGWATTHGTLKKNKRKTRADWNERRTRLDRIKVAFPAKIPTRIGQCCAITGCASA